MTMLDLCLEMSNHMLDFWLESLSLLEEMSVDSVQIVFSLFFFFLLLHQSWLRKGMILVL